MSRQDKADLFEYYWTLFVNEKTYEREYVFAKPRRFRFDFAFVDKKIAVEIDGGQWVRNGGRHNKDSDREKMCIAAMLGWRVFRISPDMLKKNPGKWIDMVEQSLLV